MIRYLPGVGLIKTKNFGSSKVLEIPYNYPMRHSNRPNISFDPATKRTIIKNRVGHSYKRRAYDK